MKSKGDKVIGKAVINLADFVTSPIFGTKSIPLTSKAKKGEKNPELVIGVVATVLDQGKALNKVISFALPSFFPPGLPRLLSFHLPPSSSPSVLYSVCR